MTKTNEDIKIKLKLADTMVRLNLMKENDTHKDILGLIIMMSELTETMTSHRLRMEDMHKESKK